MKRATFAAIAVQLSYGQDICEVPADDGANCSSFEEHLESLYAPEEEFKKHLESLHSLIMDHDGVLNKIRIHEFEKGNNGIVAEEDIDAGEIIIYVPRELCITVEDVNDVETIK